MKASFVPSLTDSTFRAHPGASHESYVQRWLASHERAFRSALNASGTELELSILDVIGSGLFYDGVTAKSVKRQLDAAPSVKLIRVLMDSPGGSFFDGLSIQALLKRSGARVEAEVLGEASSAASVIVMGADQITMHEGSMMMIHEVRAGLMGTAAELRGLAEAMDKMTASAVDLYVARTGKAREEIQALVADETWMSAQEAVALGFADAVSPARIRESRKPEATRALNSSNTDRGSPGAQSRPPPSERSPGPALSSFLKIPPIARASTRSTRRSKP